MPLTKCSLIVDIIDFKRTQTFLKVSPVSGMGGALNHSALVTGQWKIPLNQGKLASCLFFLNLQRLSFVFSNRFPRPTLNCFNQGGAKVM